MDVLTLTAYADAPFMVQQMDALEERGVSFTTMSVAGEIDAETDRSPVDYIRTVPEIIREAGNGYDLIHAHYGLTGPIALAQLRKPVVLSLWGSDVHGPVAPVSRASAPLCDEVVVMSEEMRAALGRDCRVIPDGVDLKTFRPEPQERARVRVGWDDDEDAYEVLFPYSPARSEKLSAGRARGDRGRQPPRATRATPDRLRRRSRCGSGLYERRRRAPVDLSQRGVAQLCEGGPGLQLPVVAVDVGDVRERLAGVEPSRVAASDEELVGGSSTFSNPASDRTAARPPAR